jgi:MHS family proline/betaine transporter-like MFS transporter
MTSWGAFGNQIGAIVGVLETFLMDQFMTEEFLMGWGWRISFWSGGMIGLLGIFLRKKLYETPVFNKIKEEHKIDKETALEVIRSQKSRIFLGASFCFINASTFYLIATYIPAYFGQKIGLSSFGNSIISLSILFLLTILLPVFGKIGDKFNNKTILICCSALIISLLYPMYKSINSDNFTMMAIISFFYIIPIACMAALLVYQITHLFSPSIRYTGVGLAFNLADGIVGGFTPAISLLLLEYTHNQGAFCWFILICAIASLTAYSKIKR